MLLSVSIKSIINEESPGLSFATKFCHIRVMHLHTISFNERSINYYQRGSLALSTLIINQKRVIALSKANVNFCGSNRTLTVIFISRI